MTYPKPLPGPTADDKFFWEGCKEHQLRFQRCRDCGLVRWPPNIICPNCYSRVTDIVTSSGKGIIYTYAVYHRAYHSGFTTDVPYVTAVIEMAEGPHFLSNVVGSRPEDLRCDMPVELVWEDINQEISLPKFRPVV